MSKTLRRAPYLMVATVLLLGMAESAGLSLLLPASRAAAFAGGDGTASNPYQVATCDDLESLATGDNTVHYVLTQDIDCTGVNGGAGFNPIGGFDTSQFKGVLDGGNHTISNVTIDAGDQVYVGLFGVLESATVKNLKLDHVTINNASYNAGTLAGYAAYTTVSHVSSTNFVINEIDAGWNVGGLIAQYSSGDGGVTLNTLDASSAQGAINSSSVGGAAYGGLVGELDYDTVSNSYADVAIHATGIQRAGGLVGYSYYGHIDKNYAVGSMEIYSNGGGLIGMAYTGTVVTNNFATTDIAASNGSTGGIAGSFNSPASILNNYYDQSTTAQGQCDPSNITSGCTAVNTDGTDGSHFKNTSSVAPLSSWDFVGTWQTTANYPTLQDVTGTVPGAVRSLQDEEGSGQILLNWMVPSSDGGSPVNDYLVRYRTHPSGSWSNIDIHSTTPGATINSLVNGTPYDVAVAAVNAVGVGPYSELDNLIPGAVPSAPNSAHAVVSYTDGSITFSWTAPTDTGGVSITGYQVSIRDDDGTGIWSAPISLGASTFSYNFPGLTIGNHYDVRVAAQNSFGTGTAASVTNVLIAAQVYDITTCDELQAINNDITGHYRLMNDIDCAATSSWNGGAGFIPIDSGDLGGGFSGTLDGQGHTIESLYIDSPSDETGLFSSLANGAEVSNLTLTGQVIGGANTGGLAGVAIDGVTIDHVTVQMDIEAMNVDGGFFYVSGMGGIVGLTGVDVVISHSSMSGLLVDLSDGTNPEGVGGLVGVMLDGTTISDSYANVEGGTPNSGEFYVGGIAGMMIAYLGEGAIVVTNSYATGILAAGAGAAVGGIAGAVGGGEIDNSFALLAMYSSDGTPSTGGIVGYAMLATLTNDYFDETAAQVPSCDSGDSLPGCTPVNTDGTDGNYFKGNHANAPLDGWDFSMVWQANAGDLPTLLAVGATPPSDGDSGDSGGDASTPPATDEGQTPVVTPTEQSQPTTRTTSFISLVSDVTTPADLILDLLSGTHEVTLSEGQVIHFTLMHNGQLEHHTITLTTLTGGSVVLMVASTPFDVTATLNQPATISLDGKAILTATLEGVTDGQATIVFKPVADVSSAHAIQSSAPLTWTAVAVGLIVASLVAGFVIAERRYKW